MLCQFPPLSMIICSAALQHAAGSSSAAAVSGGSGGEPAIMISEIMYNPASKESGGASEWVEIVNISAQAVTMNQWRLADEDASAMQQFGAFDATLAPGEVAVLVNRRSVDEAQFRAAWDAAGSGETGAYQIIPIDWGSLANTPTATNEILRLLDDGGQVVCEVNFENQSPWPVIQKAGGPSIWLSALDAKSANDGSRWRLSIDGEHGARICSATAIFNGADIGSPGWVPGVSGLHSSNTTPSETAPHAADQAPAFAPPPSTPNTTRYVYDQGRRYLPPRADDVLDF